MRRSTIIISLAAGVSTLAVPVAAGAQVAGAQDAEGDAGEVVVTAARGLPRTVTDSPTPIDVISGAELEKTGKPGLLQALNTLVPSFNVPARAGGSTSTIISTGGLRGLNPDQTLILINGKRRHKTALINAVSSLFNGSVPVDLDMIPVSAIDHVEVLRDGAAAQYGSDAIAGVINVILKKTPGGSISGTAGQNFDRSDGEQYQVLGDFGLKLGAAGFLNLSVSAKTTEASNRAIPIARNIRLYHLVNGQLDPREATVDRLVTKNYGSMPQKALVLGFNGGYELDGGAEFYAFGTYGQRKSDLNVTFRAPNNVASLPEIYPNGFRPREVVREEDLDIATGIRGEVAGWKADLSVNYGMNRADLDNILTLNPSLGPTSPTEFYLGRLKSSEFVGSLDLTRGYDVGGGNLQVSTGAQYRRETFTIVDGDPGSYAAGTYVIPAGQGNAGQRPAPGAQGAGGISNTDAGHIARQNVAVYGELTYDPSKALTLGAAGRFEHYDDDSGNTFIWKATARYAPTSWLAIRGAANTGFRAPSLGQQLYASTQGQFRLVNGVTNLLSIKTLAVASPAAIALGAEPLRPEKSTSFSAGVVLTPLANLSLTVDAYQIKLRDRIAITGTLTGAVISQILVANGLSPDISAQYFTNAIDTRTRGIDVVGTYRLNLGEWGQMRLNAGWNYNKTDITDIAANPPELAALGAGYVRFDRLTQSNLTTLPPKTKLYLGNVWTVSDFTLNSRLVRYGAYEIRQNLVGGLPVNDRSFGAKWVTDVEVAWQATRNFNLAVGANNLFNVYPDKNGIFNASLGSQQYGGSPPSSFGFTGGSYYARATVSF